LRPARFAPPLCSSFFSLPFLARAPADTSRRARRPCSRSFTPSRGSARAFPSCRLR
jgi:hypothetical protein